MQTPRPSRRTVLTGLSLLGLAPVLAACSGDDSLTRQAGNADGKNYIAGDGSVREIAPGERGAPVEFSAELFDGSGSVRLIWLGQRRIPGIEPGRSLKIHGRVTERAGERAIFNPWYELQHG